MALTIAERNHWKDRVEKRIDKAIKSVYSMQDPNLLKRVREKARRQAVKSLGLDELIEVRERIASEIERLEKSRKDITKQIIAKFRNCKISEVELPYYAANRISDDVTSAIEAATSPREEKLLSQDPLGRKVLELQRKKEELLDTVWLATSSSQIKAIWSEVGELLNQQQTQLQADALQIAPVDSES